GCCAGLVESQPARDHQQWWRRRILLRPRRPAILHRQLPHRRQPLFHQLLNGDVPVTENAVMEDRRAPAKPAKPFPALTPGQRLHLDVYGYVVVENVLTAQEVTTLLDTIYGIER